MLISLGTVRALEQVPGPSGAPPPRNGPFRPASYVRVLDGESFEVVIDGRRTGVGVLGMTTERYNTPCGAAARSQLQSLVGRGVVLEDDPAQVFDARKRRMYHVSTPDGRSVAAEMVGAGLARATGLGRESATLAALDAKARQEKRGCVWGGALPAASASPGARMVASAAGQVPANFVDEPVASNLNFPSSFAFLPDGRVLVGEKDGQIRLVTAQGLDPTPVLDIRNKVNNWTDRGLISVAVDPDFTTNRRFYVFFVYESTAGDPLTHKSSQVVRYTLQGNNTADPNAGTVILGKDPGAGCPALPSTADCLPAEDWSHVGGALRFGPDGRLYVSTGDASSWNFADAQAIRVQNIASLSGKVLRVDTNGNGLSDNPYWNGNAGDPVSKVWARGFRNPFRMMFRPSGPGGGALIVGDVGWDSLEEISVIGSGNNGGWPCYEGSAVQGSYYDEHQFCRTFIDSGTPVRAPIIQWPHDPHGNAALAGAFYTGAVFPSGYQGQLFYADYAQGWIRRVRLDANNAVVPNSTETFATGVLGPVQIETGQDGALWYAAISSGELRRIRYYGDYTPIQCPDGQYRAEYFSNQDLAGAPVVARCETAITYDWGYGAPFPSMPEDHYSARWTGRFTFGNDTYDFTTHSDDGVRVLVDGQTVIDDWVGGSANTVIGSRVMTAGDHTVVVEFFEDTFPAQIQASFAPRNPNGPPTPTIASPSANATFEVGEVIQLQGSASDPQQGQIPSANLRWDIIMKHCTGTPPACHDHPLVALTGANTQFTTPDHGDGTRFEIRLTATDSGGLTGVTSRTIDPQTVQITLAANPSVGTVSYDSVSHTPPFTTTTIAGSKHRIEAHPPAGQNFGGWVHGGPQEQDVTVGDQNVTYTANMGAACSPRPRVTITPAPAGANARLVTVSVASNPGFGANTLQSIQFQDLRAATVEAAGTPATALPFTLTYPNGTTQATFVARRSSPGSILVRFTVTDTCGTWPTFIGTGSPSGF